MCRKFLLLIIMTSVCSFGLAAPKPVHAPDGGALVGNGGDGDKSTVHNAGDAGKATIHNGGNGEKGGMLTGNGGSGGAGGYDAMGDNKAGSAEHHRYSGTGHAHSPHSDH